MRIKPIVLTPGEPAGIGPEITAKAWQALRNDNHHHFFLIGDAAELAGKTGVPIKIIKSVDEAQNIFSNAIPIWQKDIPHAAVAGQLNANNSPWVIGAIDQGVSFCLAGEASAIVTNPIQKEALYEAGFKHQGHTDYLAHLARQAGHYVVEVMMLVAQDLRAIPVTVHIPLKDVPSALTTEAIVAQGKVVAESLSKHFGIRAPRLAVTGLNPHAGENGAMGHEDKSIIVPAIAQLRSAGIVVQGPLPADTAFHAEARSNYDAVLCMYHDQALIPAKTLDFHGGVNVTLGLPFIRTSPDHGTALGIAGKNTANPTSLIAAIKLAAEMAQPK